jgi:hypothetical protein
MNINTSPDLISRSTTGITPGYMSGFGNSFETEALPGALPRGRNSPQRCAYGLYAEQLSGSPFTAPRGSNERSWLYRIRPSVRHSGRFVRAEMGLWRSAPCTEQELTIGQMRWDPAPMPTQDMTFLQGVHTMTTAGDVNAQTGMAAHVYLITQSMVDQNFYNADAEMMFVLQQASLRFVTEFGRIDAEPGEIVVIPRGVKHRVELTDGPARGYLCENYGGAFKLPERGPIGANCLANSRDFLTPVAAYEDRDAPTELYVKWGGQLFVTKLARQLCALQIRPAHLLAGRRHRLRPSRSLDLHRADLAVGDAGHREHRFCDFPGALAGGGKHLPPAVVPYEHHVGVHGPDLRRLRRQAEGIYAGGHEPAQLHAAARPGPRRLRARQHFRAEAGQTDRHHGRDVRDKAAATRDHLCRDLSDAAG